MSGEGDWERKCDLLSSQPAFSYFLYYPQANWVLLVLIPRGWFCVHSRTLCISPTNSPVRLGVSPPASTPTGFYSQRFWGFISLHWNPGLHGQSHSPVVLSGLSTHKCGTAWSPSCCLAKSPLHPGCQSLPLLLVWMNQSFFFNSLAVGLPYSLIFWQFWLFFLFLNLLLSFFWLCEEAKCVYLCLHLGWKSLEARKLLFPQGTHHHRQETHRVRTGTTTTNSWNLLVLWTPWSCV